MYNCVPTYHCIITVFTVFIVHIIQVKVIVCLLFILNVFKNVDTVYCYWNSFKRTEKTIILIVQCLYTYVILVCWIKVGSEVYAWPKVLVYFYVLYITGINLTINYLKCSNNWSIINFFFFTPWIKTYYL
jgi:hypothetical protein